MSETHALNPYTMARQPESDGRTFLAKAFAFFCVLEWGYSDAEIEAGLLDDAVGDGGDMGQIAGAARLLGRAFMEGQVETYARPFGGGSPALLPRSSWELDDVRPRFARSAIDPSRPFDQAAAPTHWLFVNTAQFDALLGLLDGSVAPPMATAAAEAGLRADETGGGMTVIDVSSRSDRFIKKDAVLDLVPFSRSTLDDRVRKGTFPKSRHLGGGIVVWWESEVLAWMETHGRAGGGSA